jgi:hypothetical protein
LQSLLATYHAKPLTDPGCVDVAMGAFAFRFVCSRDEVTDQLCMVSMANTSFDVIGMGDGGGENRTLPTRADVDAVCHNTCFHQMIHAYGEMQMAVATATGNPEAALMAQLTIAVYDGSINLACSKDDGGEYCAIRSAQMDRDEAQCHAAFGEDACYAPEAMCEPCAQRSMQFSFAMGQLYQPQGPGMGNATWGFLQDTMANMCGKHNGQVCAR